MKTGEKIGLFLLAMVISWGIGIIMAFEIRNHEWRKDAVVNGVAEYVTVDGLPVWQWIVPKDLNDTNILNSKESD